MEAQIRTKTRGMLGKHILVATAIFAVVALILMNGCAIIGRRPRPIRRRAVVVAVPSAVVEVVYVQKAPPKLRVETPSNRPSNNAVWIHGHWQWRGNKYVWIPGHWDKNPRGKAWVAGKWVKKPRGWVWEPGHWR